MLRVFVGALWITDAVTGIAAPGGFAVWVLMACALAVIIGFTTPIAAIAASITEGIGLGAYALPMALQPFAPIVIGIALALLGPGAYSIDARVFGRRLMEFGPDPDDDT